MRYGAVNLAQGFPDFPAPEIVKRAAMQAIDDDINQYANTWGAKPLRNAIARKYQRMVRTGVRSRSRDHGVLRRNRRHDRVAACGDEPWGRDRCLRAFYENYRPDALLCGAVSRLVTLASAALDVRSRRVAARHFHPRTKAIILNSPNNPTGRVFTREELELYRRACAGIRHARHHGRDLRAHPVRRRRAHPDGDPAGMRARTLIVNSMSKTYSVTGWRIGWVMAPAEHRRMRFARSTIF